MADPLYKQIAQDLMRKIETGVLQPDEQLPNEADLGKEYKASRNTVREAIRWLTMRGLIVRRTGQGTFVTQGIEPFVTTLHDENRDPEAGMVGGEGIAAFAEIKERLRQRSEQVGLSDQADEAWNLDEDDDSPEAPHASTPRVEVKEAPDWVAQRLRIDADQEVIVRHQEFYVGPTPWSLQTTFYPMQLVERGATDLLRPRDIIEGTVKYLAKKLGLGQCGSRLRILVRAPNEGESRFFGLPDDGRVSVISLIRTGYEERPEGPYPFRVTFTILPADRNQFVINTGKVPQELAAPARDQ
jgi:GntR family transcriptional regulator